MPTRFKRGQTLTAAQLNAALDELGVDRLARMELSSIVAPLLLCLRLGRIVSDKDPAASLPSVVGGYTIELLGSDAQTDELIPLDRPVKGDECRIFAAPKDQLCLLAQVPLDEGAGDEIVLLFAFEKPARRVCTAPGDAQPSSLELRVMALEALIARQSPSPSP